MLAAAWCSDPEQSKMNPDDTTAAGLKWHSRLPKEPKVVTHTHTHKKSVLNWNKTQILFLGGVGGCGGGIGGHLLSAWVCCNSAGLSRFFLSQPRADLHSRALGNHHNRFGVSFSAPRWPSPPICQSAALVCLDHVSASSSPPRPRLSF